MKILIISRLICFFSTVAVIAAVFIDFYYYNMRDDSIVEKKSFVATSTMFLFFFLFLAVNTFRIGTIVVSQRLAEYLSVFGAFLVLLGAIVNIIGRFKLGNRWSDNIKIYKDHRLVTNGIYSIVRHPLYASLIWMFYGASFIYFNWLAFLLNTTIFIPMMYYRAKQEEKILSEKFPEYKDYAKKTGMFFPKIFNNIGNERN